MSKYDAILKKQGLKHIGTEEIVIGDNQALCMFREAFSI